MFYTKFIYFFYTILLLHTFPYCDIIKLYKNNFIKICFFVQGDDINVYSKQYGKTNPKAFHCKYNLFGSIHVHNKRRRGFQQEGCLYDSSSRIHAAVFLHKCPYSDLSFLQRGQRSRVYNSGNRIVYSVHMRGIRALLLPPYRQRNQQYI